MDTPRDLKEPEKPLRRQRPGRGGNASVSSDQESSTQRVIRTVESLVDILLSFHQIIDYHHRVKPSDSEDLKQFKHGLYEALNAHRHEIWSAMEARVQGVREESRTNHCVAYEASLHFSLSLSTFVFKTNSSLLRCCHVHRLDTLRSSEIAERRYRRSSRRPSLVRTQHLKSLQNWEQHSYRDPKTRRGCLSLYSG